MKKTVQKFIAKLLAGVLVVSMFGVFMQPEVTTVEAADLPVVNEEEVTERVKELAKLLGVNNGSLEDGRGVLFTANGLACGHDTGKAIANNCTNCKNTYVVNTQGNWFHTTFGYTIDPALLPGHYTPTSSVSNYAWTCAGFANFALWYIAKADSTSDVYRDLIGTRGAKFTKTNLQEADIRIGDIVRIPELPHSFMFLGYVGDTGVKVLDCNWVGGDPNIIAQVRIHTISYNSSYTMAITRARNYEPGEKDNDEEINGKTYGVLDLSATSWSSYNVGQTADMYSDKAYTIYPGAVLEILDKVTNSKGNEVYYVYSEDLGMYCYVTAKYVKIIETESDGVTDFVTRMYDLILERSMDAEGQTWVELLKDGSYTGAEVAEGFIASDEFLNKNITSTQFVQIMYRAFFGREADAAGLTAWANYLDQGYSKKFVYAGFANSDEFQTLCDNYGITRGSIKLTIAEKTPNLSEQEFNVWQFVERLYSEVLNRIPDQSGMAGWVNVLISKEYTGAEVAEGFIMSDEFINKNMTNEQFVRILYKAFFNREADTTGLTAWTNGLGNGYTKRFVFAGFANSNEFGVLCDTYDITQGSVRSE